METCGSGAGAQAKRGDTVLLISIDGVSDQYPAATGGRRKGEKAKGRALMSAPGLDQSDHADRGGQAQRGGAGPMRIKKIAAW